MYVFRVDKEADDFLDIKKEYKLTKIGDHKPELRFYPNQLSGELKGKASFAILFSRDTKDIDPILSEIQENMRLGHGGPTFSVQQHDHAIRS